MKQKIVWLVIIVGGVATTLRESFCADISYKTAIVIPKLPAFSPRTKTAWKESDMKDILEKIEPAYILELLAPLIVARSVDKIVSGIKELPYQIMMKVLQAIGEKGASSPLTREDILCIIYGATIGYQSDKKKQKEILDIVTHYDYLYKGEKSLLFVAASYEKYAQVISALLMWDEYNKSDNEIKKDDKQPFVTSVEKAYEYAVDRDKSVVLMRLHNNGAVLAKEKLSLLLWKAAKEKKSDDVLSVLMEIGAEHVEQEGMTPLMFVAQHGNLEHVRALLSKGVAIHTTSSQTKKSALAIAIESKNIAVELFLRAHGARE